MGEVKLEVMEEAWGAGSRKVERIHEVGKCKTNPRRSRNQSMTDVDRIIAASFARHGLRTNVNDSHCLLASHHPPPRYRVRS